MSSLSPDKLRELSQKWLKGTLTTEETRLLDAWYNQQPQEQIEWESNDKNTDAIKERLYANISEAAFRDKQVIKFKVRRIIAWTAAACLLIGISTVGYFLMYKKPAPLITQNQIHDIEPGSNKAILKLANGQRLIVTDAKRGLLAQRGNTTIIKTADGQLTYNNTASTPKRAMFYDTLIVPRGGQHQIKFADGSIAYLNADTKLRFPENFGGSDRTVELISGEADFHVVHNAKMPFMVKANGQITKDIGTEFNINAYPDEPGIKTTLLEGRVSVSKNKSSTTLKPGQQAIISPSTNIIKVYNVDTDEAFAWKNGKFIFSNTPLEEIMRQISRWYDVDVVYKDETLKQKKFLAISTRFSNASQVLHYLELTGEVQFKIEGKKITVLNK